MASSRMRTGRPQPPRGLWGQLRALFLTPHDFFRAIPTTQSWLILGLLLFILTGVSEWQRQIHLTPSTDSVTGDMMPDMGMSDMGGMFPDSGMGNTPLPPVDGGTGTGGTATSDGNLTADLSKVLVAGSHIAVIWLITTAVFALLTLTTGYFPKFGRLFSLAIWITAPLGLMALIQLVYLAAGGKAGEPGLSGLPGEWNSFSTQSPSLQSILLSITSRMTFFYLWSMMLIYIAARQAIKGTRLATTCILLIWILLVIMLPVLTGAITVDEPQQPIPELIEFPTGDEGDMMFDPEMPFDQGEEMPENAAMSDSENLQDETLTDNEFPVEESPVQAGKPLNQDVER